MTYRALPEVGALFPVVQGSLSLRGGRNTWLAFSTGARFPFPVYLFVVAPCVGPKRRLLALREEKTIPHPRLADRAALMSRDLMSLPNPYGWERLTLAGYKRKIVARLSGELQHVSPPCLAGRYRSSAVTNV